MTKKMLDITLFGDTMIRTKMSYDASEWCCSRSTITYTCERLRKLMNYSKNKSAASQIIKQILSFYWHSRMPIAGDLRVVHQLASWMRWMTHPLRHFLVWYSWVSAFSSMCYKVSTWITDKNGKLLVHSNL
jgi:hypothetical protein